MASPTDRDAGLVRPLHKPTNPEQSGVRAGLDMLMTVTDYDILIFDLNPIISQRADPTCLPRSWILALGLLIAIEHGDSTSKREEPVSTLDA